MPENVRSIAGGEVGRLCMVSLLSGREADWDVLIEEPDGAEDPDTQTWVNGLSLRLLANHGGAVTGRPRTSRSGDVDGRPSGGTIVNRKFASPFLRKHGVPPRTAHHTVDHRPRGRGPTSRSRVIEIVGVVEDSLYDGPREGVRRQVFCFRSAQMNQPVGHGVLRAHVRRFGVSMFAALCAGRFGGNWTRHADL